VGKDRGHSDKDSARRKVESIPSLGNGCGEERHKGRNRKIFLGKNKNLKCHPFLSLLSGDIKQITHKLNYTRVYQYMSLVNKDRYTLYKEGKQKKRKKRKRVRRTPPTPMQ